MPSSSLSGASPPLAQPVTCAACFDQVATDSVPVAEDYLCTECFTIGIVPQFYEALKDETKHPVTWGTVVLTPWDYRRFFPTMFLLDWECRCEEYQTPVARRLYCNNLATSVPGDVDYDAKDGDMPIVKKKRCGAFLGRKKTKGSPTYCGKCHHHTCVLCSGPVNKPVRHECAESPSQDPFAGLKLGIDYQVCPNKGCEVKVSLWDGCNSLRCRYCYTNFCYACGKEAGGRGDTSNHWGAGKPCPRFGRAGARNAIFDPAVPVGALQPVTPEQQARIEEQIQVDQTPEGRLHGADLGTLVRVHNRITRLEHVSLIDASAHELVHELLFLIDIYTSHLLTLSVERRRFQDRFGMAAAHEEAQRLTTELGELGHAQYPELGPIVDTYKMAWDGQVDALKSVIRPSIQI